MNTWLTANLWRGCNLRLMVSLLLGGTLWLIGWATLPWPATAQISADCTPQPVLIKDDTPSVLSPSQPLVYTLTNHADCTDTFSIEATTLSNTLFVAYWEPITVEIAFNQEIPVTIHIPVIADAGNITDTIVVTAASQTKSDIKTVLVDQLTVLGGVFPTPYFVYLPMIIKKPVQQSLFLETPSPKMANGYNIYRH